MRFVPRFAIDAHSIGRRQTGNEVYIRNLLEQFARLDDHSEFITYVAPGSRFAAGPLPIPARFHQDAVSVNPCRRLGMDIPGRLRKHRPDLLHVQYTGPLAHNTPVVVTVHDVSFLQAPQFFTRPRALQLRLTVGRTVRNAARIITVSEFSRRAILEAYNVPPDKVVTIPNAASPAFRATDNQNELAAAQRRIAARYGVRGPFVLTVGDLQPRKNHLGLLRAFEDVTRSHPELDHRLVFVGKDTPRSAELHRAVQASSVRDRVHFAGFVPDDDLADFYAACSLFVFPSFYEGFGLPILEAMACGRPVLCSNTTAMPEVAGGAAILFDPYDRAQLSRKMARILFDTGLRASLERRGPRRAKLFSWERSARLTLDVYDEVAGTPRRLADAFAPAGNHADRLLLSSSAR